MNACRRILSESRSIQNSYCHRVVAEMCVGEVVDVEVVPRAGMPDYERICISHIERKNLTMRMHIRRLTRLTNAFSKKWENLRAAVALHFAQLYLTQLLINLPSLRISDLPDWLPDRWKAAQNMRLAGFA
jgi:hypothetical protein